MSQTKQRISADSETFESLYTVNKKAKRLAEKASKNYDDGLKAEARWYSQRKKALYGTKSSGIIRIIYNNPDSVVSCKRHAVGKNHGETLKLFYFVIEDENEGEWKFHVPADDLGPRDRDQIPCKVEYEDYEEDDECEGGSGDGSVKSIASSLRHLEARGLNANKQVKKEWIRVGGEKKPVGWSFLDE